MSDFDPYKFLFGDAYDPEEMGRLDEVLGNEDFVNEIKDENNPDNDNEGS
jgi:hypothetical protein